MKENNYNTKEIKIEGISLLSLEEYWRFNNFIKPCRARWWLRSPGILDGTAACVLFPGRYGIDSCDVYNSDISVRPVLEIKPGNLSVGEGFQFGGYGWTVISENLALCDKGIFKMRFRKDVNAADANVYEKSDIKQRIEVWLGDQELLIEAAVRVRDSGERGLNATQSELRQNKTVRKTTKRHLIR